MRQLSDGYERLLRGLGELPGFIVVLIVLGIATDVLLRNIGVGSIEWMIEVVEYGLFLLTFLGTAFVLRLGRHVVVDVVSSNLPARPRRLLAIIAAAVMIAICIVLFYYGVLVAWTAADEGSMLVKTFTIPEWCLLVVLPFAAILLGVESARRLRHALARTSDDPRRGESLRDGM